MNAIDRSSPLPLYVQLKQLLLDKLDNEWQPGDIIPGDQELEKRYGLSRITVRQALGDLVQEGRLERIRGRGTFVTQPKFSHDPIRRLALTEQMAEAGITPGWKLLGTDWVTPPPFVRQPLQLSNDDNVFQIRRLRLADDKPIGYHEAYVPAHIGEQVDLEMLLSQDGASLNYLLNFPQIQSSKASRQLEAVLADEPLMEHLDVENGAPILRIERTIYGDDGRTVEFLRASYRGDRFIYRITV